MLALQLLTTVASHGTAATRLLYTAVSFVKEETQAILNESAAGHLRQPFIKLLLELVNNACAPVLKAILEEKGKWHTYLGYIYTHPLEKAFSRRVMIAE